MRRTIGEEEFEELYRATARDVRAYVGRRGASDVDGLVAEVYVVAWRRRADLPAPPHRRAWLFGVARTLLLAEGRSQRRERELTEELAVRPAPSDVPLPADGRITVVTAALARLSVHDREVLQLVAWEGLSPAELAVALGIRSGTARVRLHRARRALAADPTVQALIDVPASAADPSAGLTAGWPVPGPRER